MNQVSIGEAVDDAEGSIEGDTEARSYAECYKLINTSWTKTLRSSTHNQVQVILREV